MTSVRTIFEFLERTSKRMNYSIWKKLWSLFLFVLHDYTIPRLIWHGGVVVKKDRHSAFALGGRHQGRTAAEGPLEGPQFLLLRFSFFRFFFSFFRFLFFGFCFFFLAFFSIFAILIFVIVRTTITPGVETLIPTCKSKLTKSKTYCQNFKTSQNVPNVPKCFKTFQTVPHRSKHPKCSKRLKGGVDSSDFDHFRTKSIESTWTCFQHFWTNKCMSERNEWNSLEFFSVFFLWFCLKICCFYHLLLHMVVALGVDTVLISGCATNCCCEATARDAMQCSIERSIGRSIKRAIELSI